MQYTKNDINLLKYAIESGVVEYVNVGASIDKSIRDGGTVNLRFRKENKDNQAEAAIDDPGVPFKFNNDEPGEAEAEFLRVLRLKLPVVEIVDLVTVAVEKELVKNKPRDPSAPFAVFSDFGGDYNKLISYEGYFTFLVIGDGGAESYYNVTFNRSAKFPRGLHVEYLSRSSMFIKAILDKVMNNYNKLIVAKAMMPEDSVLPPPLAPEFEQVGGEKLENSNDVIENEIHGQIKVIISYRDNINNRAYSERIIDDIYVDNADTAYPAFSVKNILPSDNSVGTRFSLEVPDDERKALQSIVDLLKEDKYKFEIFDTLRNSPNTALHRLINRRISEYVPPEDGASHDGELPKIEFTITPIAIYSNHIVRNIKLYEIAYVSPPAQLQGFTLEYKKVIEPGGSINHEIKVEGAIAPVVITGANPLVIALCNDYTSNPPKAIILPRSHAVKLCENNPTYYGGAEYRNVYFDKSKLVVGSDIGYSGTEHADKYFLKDDLRVCALTAKQFHRRDIVYIDGGEINSKGELENAGLGQNVYKGYTRTCASCGTVFGVADPEYWREYTKNHVLDDIGGATKQVCDNCVGTVSGGKAILKDNSADGIYYTDTYGSGGEALARTALCPCCLADDKTPSEQMTVNTSPCVPGSGNTTCRICGKKVCKKHYDAKLGVCTSCKGVAASVKTFNSSHPMWKPVKRYLRVFDRFCKNIKIDDSPRTGEIRLFLTRSNGSVVVYYMYRTGESKERFAIRNIETR